jgi:hypothetical protein
MPLARPGQLLKIQASEAHLFVAFVSFCSEIPADPSVSISAETTEVWEEVLNKR